MKPFIKILVCFLLMGSTILLNTACRKETVTPPVIVTIPIPPPPPSAAVKGEHIFDSLYWNQYSGVLRSINNFRDLFNNIISNFDTAYYKEHLQVFLKFSVWTSIPYIAHDHNGLSNHDIYFTDDNYTATFAFPTPITINVPGIIIIAKPGAPINFLLPVSVKVIITP